MMVWGANTMSIAVIRIQQKTVFTVLKVQTNLPVSLLELFRIRGHI